MKPLYPFLLLLLWCCGAVGQNLVPNGSFEILSDTGLAAICPNGGGQIFLSKYWTPSRGTVDFYHACSNEDIPDFGVPHNVLGFQPARTGVAYASLITYALIAADAREFVSIELSSPLIAGNWYKLQFYISLSDSSNFSAQIGGYCSQQQTSLLNQNDYFAFSPNVEFVSTFPNLRREFWYPVVGYFQAEGGERYLTIGNFRRDSEDSMVSTRIGNSNPEKWDICMYLIDDVSLEALSLTDISEEYSQGFAVYPNPATDNVTIELSGPQRLVDIHVFDVVGRTVHTETRLSENRMRLNLTHLPSGQYVISLFDGEIRRSQKLMVTD